jgi:hypothetical protein
MKAFGIEPNFEPYSLRQARYFELGLDIAAHAQHHFARTVASASRSSIVRRHESLARSLALHGAEAVIDGDFAARVVAVVPGA